MGLKALLHNNLTLIVASVLLFGCFKPAAKKANNIFEKVDVSSIPNNTISEGDSLLKVDNGVYYVSNKPFSGYIKSTYSTDTIKSISSYFLGRKHGTTKTFFPNGKLETERNYKDGIGYGRHFGFWENGYMKFDYMYFNDKREGPQKQWYHSGKPYAFLTFKDDKEDGRQQAWRENGKVYINYEVKDGARYGLQKSALCYTLIDQKIKTK